MSSTPAARSLPLTLLASASVVIAASAGAYVGAFDGPAWAWLRAPGVDKLAHALVFGSLAFGAHLALRGRRRFGVPLAILLPALLIALDELAQVASPRRTPDPLDLLADVVGLLMFERLARASYPFPSPD